jgi:hypothetical protein
MGNPSGFTTLSLICQNCGERFGLAASTGKSPEKLSDPFEAKCPHCENQSTYPKSAIQILTVSQVGERP